VAERHRSSCENQNEKRCVQSILVFEVRKSSALDKIFSTLFGISACPRNHYCTVGTNEYPTLNKRKECTNGSTIMDITTIEYYVGDFSKFDISWLMDGWMERYLGHAIILYPRRTALVTANHDVSTQRMNRCIHPSQQSLQ